MRAVRDVAVGKWMMCLEFRLGGGPLASPAPGPDNPLEPARQPSAKNQRITPDQVSSCSFS